MRIANLLLLAAAAVLSTYPVRYPTVFAGHAPNPEREGVQALMKPHLAPGAERPAHRPARPNILILLADDMGYSDLSCYGGEVRTPNLDGLAKHGLRFTQFYNTTRCWPSRAAILTGYYAQQVRRDTVPGIVQNGMQGVRPTWARLLPDFLKPLGYRSYHSGKWHIDGMPLQDGFDRSYLLLDQDRYFSPRVHYEDDQPLPPVAPDSGYYATTAIVDHALKCLKEHAEQYSDRPFFHYLAFTCPHFPLQALPEDFAKYRNRFRAGWDVLRQQRLRRMKAMGIVRCDLSPRTPGVPAWDSLSAEQQQQWQIRMALHAALVDRMDHEIGRVLAQLKRMGALDNTVLFFLSDNGASAEIVDRGDGNDPTASPGSAKSFLCLEPGWANLANAPLRRSKIFVHEGGISTSLIVHWPRGLAAKGELRHNPGHVIDLAPTILELAGGTKPDTWNGQPIPPAPGHSLVPTFVRDGSVTHDYFWWFHSGNRAIRVGDWKLVAEGPNSPWELYDLQTDRSEIHDLSAAYPDRVHDLEQAWNTHMEEFRALAALPNPDRGPVSVFRSVGRQRP
jgi:arylsulfatase A-like enzyme